MNLPYHRWLTEAPRHIQQTGRPLVGLCYAQSLDGSIANRGGEPLALSGAQSNTITHQIRSRHDSILIGIGTLLSDNPQLTVRLAEGKHPLPLILDSQLRTPLDCKLLQPFPGRSQPWIAATQPVDRHRREVLESRGIQVIDLPPGPSGGVSLIALLEYLADAGIRSVMVEGGGKVITSFLSQNLFDWVGITIAPVFVGGYRALQTGLSDIAMNFAWNETLRLTEIQSTQAGADIWVWGRR